MEKVCENQEKDWQETKERLSTDRLLRVGLLSSHFWLFMQYYFPEMFFYEFADRHYEYALSLESDQNILVVGHRESVKTQLANIYVIRCIVYKKYMYILRGGYAKEDAQKNVYDIRTLIEENDSLKEDFGDLLFGSEKRIAERKSEKTKSVKSIHFSNGVFLNTTSIRKSTRGFKHTTDNRVYRPELLILDDIDVNESVQNTKIIDKNYVSLTGQCFGGLPGSAKIVCLGNVIVEDGLVPRLWEEKFDTDSWDCYRIPSFIHDEGVCYVNNQPRDDVGSYTWSRFVETEEEARSLNQEYMKRSGMRVSPFVSHEYLREKDGQIGYSQNHLLIPYLSGETIIKRDMVKYGWLEVDHTVMVVIGVDPSFSEKTNSDPLGVSVTYHKMINSNHYKFVYDVYELKGQEKEESKVISFIKNLYTEHNATLVRVEGNNGGEYIGKKLKKQGLSVEIVHANKDKITRLREREGEFTQGRVYFRKGINKNFVEQLFQFPQSKHDDMVDAMVYSLGEPAYAGLIVKQYKSVMDKTNGKKRGKTIRSDIGGRF